MEKNFKFIIWSDYEVVKIIRCKGRILDNEIVPLNNKTHNIDCGDVGFDVSREGLFGLIQYSIEEIKAYEGDIDVDVYAHVTKMGHGILGVEIGGYPLPCVEDDVEEHFINLMSAMIQSIEHTDDIEFSLRLIITSKWRYKDVRNKIHNNSILRMYDDFYEVVDAPMEEWLERFKLKFKLRRELC